MTPKTPAEANSTSDATKPKTRRQSFLQLGGVILGSAAVTAGIILFKDQIQSLGNLGYPGVLITSFLASATVIFPAPSLALTFAMGNVLNPFLVGILAGVGEAAGEIVGYFAGYYGRSALIYDKRYEKLENITRRYGPLAIFGLAALPIGVFDFVGIAAGAMRMSLPRFLLFALLGKTLKTTIVANIGGFSLDWLLQLIH